MKNLIESVNSSINDRLTLKIFKGVVTSILVTLVFLFLLSVILTYSNISEAIIPISIVVISAVSILIGSLLTTKKKKKKRNNLRRSNRTNLYYTTIFDF